MKQKKKKKGIKQAKEAENIYTSAQLVSREEKKKDVKKEKKKKPKVYQSMHAMQRNAMQPSFTPPPHFLPLLCNSSTLSRMRYQPSRKCQRPMKRVTMIENSPIQIYIQFKS